MRRVIFALTCIQFFLFACGRLDLAPIQNSEVSPALRAFSTRAAEGKEQTIIFAKRAHHSGRCKRVVIRTDILGDKKSREIDVVDCPGTRNDTEIVGAPSMYELKSGMKVRIQFNNLACFARAKKIVVIPSSN